MANLNVTVLKDIEDFLAKQNQLFFNERDVQMHLALALKDTKHYDNVELEYYIPIGMFNNKYPWETETLYIDIVVCKDDEYCPIELKYKTQQVPLQANTKFSRFGKVDKTITAVFKDQQRGTDTRYDFWKDVRRIEVIKNNFPKVVAGFAVFLTNDELYTTRNGKKENGQSCNYEDFSMQEGKQNNYIMNWKGDTTDHPTIIMDSIYTINWKSSTLKYQTTGIDFHYCIVEVPPINPQQIQSDTGC